MENECFICERPLDEERECEYCSLQSGKTFNPPEITVRQVVQKTPTHQLPVRDEPIDPFINLVDKAESYLLKVREGLNPEVPSFINRTESLDAEPTVGTYPLREPLQAPDYHTYGNHILGIEPTLDLHCTGKLLLVDIDWPIGDIRYEELVKRNADGKITYLVTLNRRTALYGKMTRLHNLYLSDESERMFTTYESIKYYAVKVLDFNEIARGFWNSMLQLSPIQKVKHLEDFLVYKVEGPFEAQPLNPRFALVRNTQSVVIQSHPIQMVARPRTGDTVVTLGSRPALLWTPNAGTTRYSILDKGVLVFNKRHHSLVPSVEEFMKRSPTSKTHVGRVYISDVPNLITPNVLKHCKPVVRIDDGPICLVKLETRTHTTVFISKEEGPFIFYMDSNRPLRDEDTCRFAVSYATFPNDRVKQVGTAYSALYSEYSGHDYVVTSRLITTPFGSMLKKALDEPMPPELLTADLKKEFPELTFHIYKTIRETPAGKQVHQIYITCDSSDDLLLEFYHTDANFLVNETLHVPLQVFVDPKAFVIPEGHNLDMTEVSANLDFFEL